MTWGFLFDQHDREHVITDGDCAINARHYFTLPWDARATDGTPWPEGGAILIRLARHDFLLAGSGVVVDFKTVSEKQQEQQLTLGEDGFIAQGDSITPQNGNRKSANRKSFKGHRLGIGFVDEVSITPDGQMRYLRRHNGDQDHQGRHARISVGEWKILHIRLYEY